ncbi:hypothetical protein LTR74_013790 [Friedmanniomyces endolithicus]|nr:hypothetical protein LTR74_013790 [Friedmanniomyces endolithicus]
MSRYPPPEYRGFRERSRSPPRFSDRRGSTTALFPSRPEPPRGPRQFDNPPLRPSITGAPGSGPGQRPSFSSLRDAPPLGTIGSNERDRPPFRARDFDRPPRVPSPRDRSPPRAFKDPREYPPRELDIARAQRASRDGPPSAGSTYSEIPLFAPGPGRGGFVRGRGRGELEPRGGRGGRGGRREFEDRDRDLFRREKSPPPPRWSRDLSREGREPERRDDRRIIRREEERRPEWYDRERDVDRSRGDQLAPRLETRRSDESIASAPPPPQASQTLQIDPGRLALLEQAGADLSVRRPSVPQNVQPVREPRRELPETPSYLNGRAETTANRYAQRGSSPPTHAPPVVPAFTLSFAPSATTPSTVPAPSPFANAKPTESKNAPTPAEASHHEPLSEVSYSSGTNLSPYITREDQVRPAVAQTQLKDPLQDAPKAPRLLEDDPHAGMAGRLHGVRSLENVQASGPSLAVPRIEQPGSFAKPSPSGPRAVSPAASTSSLPAIVQPQTQTAQTSRFGELAAPTGPRATPLASVSPRPPFASPRSDVGAFQGFAGLVRGQTPPPTAPSGPRNQSFSVSPKATGSTVPTAPRGIRAPRAADRIIGGARRVADRPGPQFSAQSSRVPPTAPKSLQWNQWRRPGPAQFGDKIVPAKRDFFGEPRERPSGAGPNDQGYTEAVKHEDFSLQTGRPPSEPAARRLPLNEKVDLDHGPVPQILQPSTNDHSARQSFFGKPEEPADEDVSMSEAADEIVSSSDDDDPDPQQILALAKAKFERQKRVLEAQMIDISEHQYRATTPRESIARLSRLSEKDLRRAQEHHEMDIDDSPPTAEVHLMPPATHSSGTNDGPEIHTPKGAEDADVEVHSNGESSDNVRQMRRPSPEVISLPYLAKEPHDFQDAEALRDTIRRQEESKSTVIAALDCKADHDFANENEADANFDAAFTQWRQQCEEFDRLREEQERLERHMSVEPGPEMLPPVAPSINPIAEGRRLHKNSSEYEIEQVIKQSEATARVEQERNERESRKLQADMEKEAKVADQQNEESFKRNMFVDVNRLRDPDTLTLVYSYEPQPDTFTVDEQQLFTAAFKETPKKWGEISSLLVGRTYRDCIHHYYANKWDGRFRDNRTKKLKAGGRRGRGGKTTRGRGGGAMADMAGVEEILPPQSMSESGRPRRAAAPTTFGEKEVESKAALIGPSPAKKLGPAAKLDANGEAVMEKPVKRRKVAGEKPGRKAKAPQQPYAALAAAPIASPNKQFLQAVPTKEDHTRAQNFEEAALLASLQLGQNNLLPTMESQTVYHHEEYAPSLVSPEELARMKAAGQPPGSRSGASSYWSVPEQQDFVKYIAHFGTDFAAIANHMGTKTQTMIKNHYQRQVGSGNQPELENAAREADKRRETGDDVGPPPTPTPIVKRKYDQPQPTAPRALAPLTDAMELDEPVAPPRQAQPNHVSPPQYQAQPRFTSSAQTTPIPAQRVVPSAVNITASPAPPKTQAPVPPRPVPHPFGAGLAFTTEPRPDSRPSLPSSTIFRHTQGNLPPRSQPQQQSGQHHEIMERLLEEKNRALRMQQEQSQQEQLDQLHRQPPFNRGSAQGSPADQLLRDPVVERKPLFEEQRAPTPPRPVFSQTPFSRPILGSSTLGPFRSTPFSLMGRIPANSSPPKNEEARPMPLPIAPPIQTARTTMQAPPPDPPKRSNLLSILNDEPDEPKHSKRDSLPGFAQRVVSPAPPTVSSAPTPAPGQNMHPLRRETFGQPSLPQSQFHRPSFSQSGPMSSAAPPTVKQEHASGMLSTQVPKPDWAARVLQPSQSSQRGQPSPPPPLERDVRPYFSHRTSALGGLNQPGRANPSPPPHSVLGHSRTSSLTMQANQPLREQRSVVPTQQAQHIGHGAALHPNPYAQQPAGSPLPQLPQPEARNHAHHSHNSSLTGGFPPFHQRAPTRDEAIRQEHQQQHAFAALRERDEMERQRRAHHEFEFRQREAFFVQQRQQQQQHQEEDREHQQRQQPLFARGPPPPPPPQPLQPLAFKGQAFAPDRPPASLREQSKREMEAAMREQEITEERMQEDALMREQHERRHFEEQSRRRQQLHEEAFRRQTPLGGGFGHPPPRR